MATTEIKQFCSNPAGSGGNRLTPSAYAALTSLLANGFQSGVADSKQVTTAIAQASFMAAGLANWMVAQGVSVPDDSNLAGLVTKITTALTTFITGSVAQNVFTGGTTTGSANAQVIGITSPSVSSFSNGQSVICTAGFTNTGSMTFNAGGEGALTVKKDAGTGLTALSGGEVEAGDTVMFTKNTAGNCWVLTVGPFLNPSNNLSDVANAATALANLGTSKPVQSSFKNLSAAYASNTSITLTADEITVEDASGNTAKVSALNATISTGTTGANGCDVAFSGFSANSWAYGYVIAKPDGTKAGILSASSTAPTLPSGYTFYSGPVTAVRLDGSKNIIGFTQKGRDWQYKVGSNLSAPPIMISGVSGSVTTPTWTAQSVANYVPTAVAARIKGSVFANTAGAQNAMAAPNNSYGQYEDPTNPPPVVVSATTAVVMSVPYDFVLESSNVYYAGSGSGCGMTCAGFTLNI